MYNEFVTTKDCTTNLLYTKTTWLVGFINIFTYFETFSTPTAETWFSLVLSIPNIDEILVSIWLNLIRSSSICTIFFLSCNILHYIPFLNYLCFFLLLKTKLSISLVLYIFPEYSPLESMDIRLSSFYTCMESMYFSRCTMIFKMRLLHIFCCA